MKRVLHKVVRCLPDRWRRDILPMLFARMIMPLVMKARDVRPGPVAIMGLLSSTVGLGQGARLGLRAFQRLKYDVTYIDVGEIFYWHRNIDGPAATAARRGEGGLLVVHLNPPEMAMVLPLYGRGFIRHKRVIGVWAWELDIIPGNWLPGLKMVDEIWAPSSFVAEALASVTSVPIRVVHHPLEEPRPPGRGRVQFGLAREVFVVLHMFDMRSSAERKNPLGAIRAFRMAFGGRSDVVLVIKIGTPEESPEVMADIEREIESTTNVRLMFDRLSQDENADLIASSDVVLSLHRSEGFGLVPAEAMFLGKPVIATAYSGNMDFMDAQCAALVDYKLIPVVDPQGIYKAGEWADPDLEQAAQWLKRLEGDPGMRDALGRQARSRVEEYFSMASFEKAIGSCSNLMVKARPTAGREAAPVHEGPNRMQ